MVWTIILLIFSKEVSLLDHHWTSLRVFIRGAFLLFGKTGCSGDKSNGTYFSTGNFSKKKEYLLRHGLMPWENMALVFTCLNKDSSFQSMNTDDFIGLVRLQERIPTN